MENKGYQLDGGDTGGSVKLKSVHRRKEYESDAGDYASSQGPVSANGHAPEKPADNHITDATSKGPPRGNPMMKKRVYDKKVSFFGLYRFADGIDNLLMFIGTLGALCTGAALPFNMYLLGNMITDFVNVERQVEINNPRVDAAANAARWANLTGDAAKCYQKLLNSSFTQNSSSPVINGTVPSIFDIIVEKYVYLYCGLAVGVLLLSYMSMFSWVYTAERQVRKVRVEFFKSIMKQDIGWFDTYQAGELNTRMSDDLDRLRDGFGDKMATFVQWLTTFIGGFTIGLVQGWQLALTIMAVSPLLALSAAILGRIIRTFVQRELKAYAKAGSVATEILTAIRTVTAFGGQEKAARKYHRHLIEACAQGVKKAIITGFMAGVVWVLIFGTFALAFWYGAKLVREECMDTGVIVQVFMGVFVGAISLGNAVPLLENFANARGAAAALFEIIDKPSKIDSSKNEGEIPSQVTGAITFENIHFVYPARPEVTIMKKLSLSIKPGQKVALVGPSGCGKSTLIQLIQRFYDPLGGCVKLDGRDLRSLNVRWLRGNVGVVGQEPVLFSASIEDNIRLGASGDGAKVSDEDIVRACKAANCYEFIMRLPEKLKTLVGERGAQLSGGQKQRIAIARALVSDPRVLLLDEATSALDTQSELVVQEALDMASKGRTTIIVAHRLSTVKNADVIFGIKDGEVVEFGTHDELMSKQGLYCALHAMQQKKTKTDGELSEDEDDLAEVASFGRNRALSIASSTRSHEGSDLERSPFRQSQRSTTRTSQRPGDGFTRATHSRGDHHGHQQHPGESFIRASLRASLRSLQDGTKAALAAMQARPIGDVEAVLEDEQLEEAASKEDAIAEINVKNVQMSRIYKMNLPELKHNVIGCIAALIAGGIQPAFAVLTSEMVGAIGITLDPDEQDRKVLFWSLMMVAVGLASAIAALIKNTAFGIAGEKLTERLRLLSFRAMLNQEVGWYDEQKNQVGILTARLASDASQIRGATGVRLGVIMQSLATVGIALAVSYIFSWQLAVVMMFFMPLTISSGIVQHRVLKGFAESDKTAMEEGGRIAQETISNIRTVVSLNKEKYFVEKFSAHYKKMYMRDRRKSLLAGIAFSFSNSLVYFGYAVCYTYGSYLVDTTRFTDNPVQFYYILRVFSAINFGGTAVGRAVASAPDYTTAKVAAAKLLGLLDRKSLINSSDTSGTALTDCQGNIEFHDVMFRYPSRPTIPILRGFTVSVKKGEKLALVGASGCGKSTAVSILERFYDPLAGAVTLDGLEIRSIRIQDLRKQMGIVAQEPLLFDASIAENIAYGDNSRTVQMAEIIEAAKKANIHNFISELPQGYETNVGDKGTQLSGGQKQRIAIARALVRNPRILLLDEATSALDTESEKVVQDALDRAQHGRTCVIIAHRLSTVKTADRIAVIHQGQVAELGTHDELLAKKKLYFKLVNAQL